MHFQHGMMELISDTLADDEVLQGSILVQGSNPPNIPTICFFVSKESPSICPKDHVTWYAIASGFFLQLESMQIARLITQTYEHYRRRLTQGIELLEGSKMDMDAKFQKACNSQTVDTDF